MTFVPKPQEIYRHFKGNLYQITAIAEHTETGEQLVVYQALYGEFKTYARPLPQFVSRVDREKYPDIEQEFRFELQGADAARQWEAFSCADQKETAQESRDMEKSANGETEAVNKKCDVAESDVPVEDSGEAALDPLLLEFLDADSYEKRLNILAGLHHRITDEMITTMAIAADVEIADGDVEERYEALKNCLLTMERYECNRLR